MKFSFAISINRSQNSQSGGEGEVNWLSGLGLRIGDRENEKEIEGEGIKFE